MGDTLSVTETGFIVKWIGFFVCYCHYVAILSAVYITCIASSCTTSPFFSSGQARYTRRGGSLSAMNRQFLITVAKN
jgi:hypothetical protein